MPAEGLWLLCPSVLLKVRFEFPVPYLALACVALTQTIQFPALLKTGPRGHIDQASYIRLVQSPLDCGQGMDVIFLGMVVMHGRHPYNGCRYPLPPHDLFNS